MNGSDLVIPQLLVLLAGALGIAWWAARRIAGGLDWHSAPGILTGWQGGLALAGDLVTVAMLAAAAALGVPGLGAPVLLAGALIGLVLALVLLAEPLRNSGRSLAAVLGHRFPGRPVRATAAAVTAVVSGLLAVAALVGAGALVRLLYGATEPLGLPLDVLTIAGLALAAAAVTAAGGLLAAIWTGLLRTLLVAAGLAILIGTAGSETVARFLREAAGTAEGGGAELLSLGLAVVLGAAVLPTLLGGLAGLAPGGQVRSGLRWALGAGLVLLLLAVPVTLAGAVTGRSGGLLDTGPIAAPLDAGTGTFGGDVLLAGLAVVVLLAVFGLLTGLAVTASRALAVDLRSAGQSGPAQPAAAGTLVAAAAAAIVLREADAGALAGMALAAAASALLPVALLTLYWRRLTAAGALTGLVAGLGSALLLAGLGATGALPLHVPALISVPVALAAAAGVSLLTPAGRAAVPFGVLRARAFTGQGAEVDPTGTGVS